MMRDLTKGKPIKVMLSFFLPVLLGNLFQQFYNIADTAIVGKFVGTEALAGVGSVGALYFLVIGFVWGMCGGFLVPIARSFGAGDLRSLRVYLANMIYLAVGITILLTVATVLSTEAILRLMNTPDNMFDHAYRYTITIFAGIGATVFYNIVAGVARAVGDSRTPLYFLVVSSLLNIGLDLLFIIPFQWGTFGAALATVIAQFIAATACFFYMKKKFPQLKIQKGEWRANRAIMGELLGISMPMALQFSITAIGGIILQSSVNPFGSDIVATVTAASKVQLLIFQPLEAMGITVATFTSQNLGARNTQRIRAGVRTSVVLIFAFSLLSLTLGLTVGAELSQAFVDAEQTDIREGAFQFLLCNGVFYWSLGLLFILRNTIQGLGFSLPAMGSGLLELLARVFCGLFLVPAYGFTAICFANSLAWLGAIIMLIPMYFMVMRNLEQTIRNTPPNQGQLNPTPPKS